jgi:hypothetical protein
MSCQCFKVSVSFRVFLCGAQKRSINTPSKLSQGKPAPFAASKRLALNTSLSYRCSWFTTVNPISNTSPWAPHFLKVGKLQLRYSPPKSNQAFQRTRGCLRSGSYIVFRIHGCSPRPLKASVRFQENICSCLWPSFFHYLSTAIRALFPSLVPHGVVCSSFLLATRRRLFDHHLSTLRQYYRNAYTPFPSFYDHHIR